MKIIKPNSFDYAFMENKVLIGSNYRMSQRFNSNKLMIGVKDLIVINNDDTNLY